MSLYVITGKFGQRHNMGTWQYITKPNEFLKLMVDKTKKLREFHIVNEDTIQVSWCHEDTFEPDSLMTQEVVATMTTAWARLELYKVGFHSFMSISILI